MKTKIIVLALCIGFTLLNCADKKNYPVTVVSVEEMDTLLSLEDVQLIDVRTKDEYDKGHIKKSQNIDFNSPTFDTDIISLDKEQPVILYCQRGGRSAKCAEKMQKAGFKKIYDLKGGFSKWQFKSLDLKVKS